jgi:hypothetical protein
MKGAGKRNLLTVGIVLAILGVILFVGVSGTEGPWQGGLGLTLFVGGLFLAVSAAWGNLGGPLGRAAI